MSDLAEFLLARIAEEEGRAERAIDGDVDHAPTLRVAATVRHDVQPVARPAGVQGLPRDRRGFPVTASETPDAAQPPEMYTTVPFKYRARLRLYDSIPAKDYSGREAKLTTKTVEHTVHIAGSLHPRSENYDDALGLANLKLQPLREIGWRVESLIVTGWGDQDA